MSATAEEAAAEVLADLVGEGLQEGEPAEQERAREHLQNLGAEEPEPQPEGDPEDNLVELPAAAPEEYLDDEPDFAAEAELEATPPDEEEEFEYDDNEALRKERAARIIAEKKAAHYEGLRAKDARKLWIAEAKEKCGLAVKLYGDDLSGITASSKKAFMKQAAQGHNAIRSALEELVGPEREKVTAETRAAAQKQFGKPTTGPAVVPAEAAAVEAEVAKAVESGSLRNVIREMWRGNQIEI